MSLAYLGLLGRIIFLGVERIAVKRLGDKADPFAGAFLFFFIGAVLLFPFVFLENGNFLQGPWPYLKGALGSGCFYSVAFVCYVRALSGGEVSLVSPLYNFNVFFLAILALVFLGEPFGVAKGVGLFLLVYGASFLTREGGGFVQSLRALLTDIHCRYMVVASFLIAVGRVADKYLIAEAPPVAYAFVLYMIIAIYIGVFMIVSRRVHTIWPLFKKRPVAATISGAINGYSYLFLLLALKELDVSVAEPASMLGLIVTLILSRMMLHEKIGKRGIAVGIMICGSWCLFL
ncbi:MAG: DMT family transporter [Desulfovibrio sp.]